MSERERLIELIDQAQAKSDDNFGMTNSEQMAGFLISNGVIVPPCSIGDTVYEIRENGRTPIRGKRFDRCITTVQMLDCAAIRKSTLYAKEKRYAKSDSVRLGKTVFLTREEAEKALEEREDNG